MIELVSDDKVSLFFIECSHCNGADTDSKVDFTIDTSLPQSARPALDWNSKKAGESQKALPRACKITPYTYTDDDQIETAIAVRYRFAGEGREQTIHTPQTTSIQETAEFPQSNNGEYGHGINIDNNVACCKEIAPRGLVDCLACLDEAWASFSDTLDPESRTDAIWILDTVRQTKEVGVRKSDLIVQIITPFRFEQLGFTFFSYRHPQVLELHEYHF